ncbi:MAG: DUF1669 domain-containing protein [bacterium]|nr:DUF1669 domain-containing protein [bacterium]
MMKFVHKLVSRLVVAALLLGLALAIAAGLHFYRGGSWQDVSGDLTRLWDRAASHLDEARDALSEGVDRAEGLAQRAGVELDRGFEAEEGRIAVYFAPCELSSPWGIDDRLIAFLEGAEKSIYCAFYELQLPAVADILVAKHEAGLKVGIVTDSEYQIRDAIQACIRAGIPVVFDDRSPFMHNKFCVVDGARVWTGSTNITENGMYRNNNNVVLVESSALAQDYLAEFQEMYSNGRFGGRSPRNTQYPELRVGSVTIECYFAPEDKAEREIVEEIEDAGQSIDFMAFSFTSEPIAEAMAERMEEDVRVRGLFEKRGAGSSYSRDDYLRDRGAEVHMDSNKYTMHHKVIVLDRETVVTGSYNFSKSAEKKNDENVLIIHDPEIAERFTQEFEQLISK